MKRDFLLEIGAENIPAFYILPAVEQLRASMRAWLDESRLSYDDIYVTGTPRRLAVIVNNLADRQDASEELVTGPPAERAYDENGAPTKAAEGFARAHGIAVDKLATVDTPRGEFIGFRRTLKRAKTTTMLRGHMGALIAGLRFPKTMKWEPSGARFARPVRWIVCLYGRDVVRVCFADVTSGNRSYGRPWMKGESVAVKSAGSYHTSLARLGIIVDHEQRRERVRSLAGKAAARIGLHLVEDDNLITELTFMVEDPHVIVGEFPEEYLKLPPEVVTAAMRSHQRYITLVDDKKKLVPHFITFTDGRVTSPAQVRRGNEKVLKARLADAQFYWNEDIRRGVDGLSDELDRIVFIEGLGTLGQKWRRIETLALALNDRLSRRERVSEALVSRASKLAKFDLASEMIKDGKEFTKLQGLIGSHYARVVGEDRDVVAAIAEHYRPRTPAERVPRSTLGALVGVADRVDTICGCFLAGFIPTGSQDPYALRRLANGLIRIVSDEPGIHLDELIEQAVALYVGGGFTTQETADGTRGALVDFFKARCEAYLKDKRVPYDVANAVKPLSWAQPGLALDRSREIARLRGDSRFERLITGVKRVGNILSAQHRLMGLDWGRIHAALDGTADLADGIGFSGDLFQDPPETALLDALRKAAPRIVEFEQQHDFAEVLHALSTLADPIDAYFDGVLVNCEDSALRSNRHGFLAAVYALFSRYADFSEIVEEGIAAPRS